LTIARLHLKQRLAEFHDAAYLSAIGHQQAAGAEDLVRRGELLDKAYAEYRAVAASLNG
jgi:hypothetical protein